MANHSILQRDVSTVGKVCAGFMLAGTLMCGSPDRLTSGNGKVLLLATLFAGTLFSGLCVTGENMRDAVKDQRPSL